MTGTNGPLRVVIDTDAANEIDDQFALAWALAAPDRIELEAIHAAPFGHGHYLQGLVAARARRAHGETTPFEQLAIDLGPDLVADLGAQHPPAEGMERSLAEIERVLDTAAPARRPPVQRGSERFMTGPDDPVESDAARHLIELAHAADDPLYVAVIGAPTNVASALLLDPSIAEKIVVLFVAGYPSASPHVDESFNLVQDRHASNVVLGAENLVYIPGYQVSETLSVSLPELELHLAGASPIGDLLVDLYRTNPLASGQDQPGHSWVVWDLAPIAWLIDPSWVRTFVTARATIGPDHHWACANGEMNEAYRVDRRAVYTDLFARLGAHR